jgi:hypothetical protein
MITIYNHHHVLFDALKFLWLKKCRYITWSQRILVNVSSAKSYVREQDCVEISTTNPYYKKSDVKAVEF